MEETRPRRIDGHSAKGRVSAGAAGAVFTLAATTRGPRLVFADEFVEVFKEADEDHDQRPGKSDQKEAGQQVHSGVGKSNHTRILNQARRSRDFTRNTVLA
jgi:hypothetical protein